MPEKKQAAAYLTFLTILMTILSEIVRRGFSVIINGDNPSELFSLRGFLFDCAGIWVLFFVLTLLIGAGAADILARYFKKKNRITLGLSYTGGLVPLYAISRILLLYWLTGHIAEGHFLSVLAAEVLILIPVCFVILTWIALPAAGKLLVLFVKGYTRVKKK